MQSFTLTEAVETVLLAQPGDIPGCRVGDEELFIDRNNINTDRKILILCNRKREVTNEDLDVVRKVLAEQGFREVKSWVSYVGQSWLSSGVFTSVSFEVAPSEAQAH